MRGWDVEAVVERGAASWQALVQTAEGNGVLATDVVTHNLRMCFAYALGVAASGRSDLTVLDWGGGLGQYGVLATALFPDVTIAYHCRDLPLMTAAGRQLQPQATFHDSDAEAFAGRYDMVMASSSLQYVPDWRSTLTQLVKCSTRYVFITRQPFVEHSPSFVVIQRPFAHGYNTEYAGWALNRNEFVDAAERAGCVLRREVLTGEDPYVAGAPEQPTYRGFLFERAGS
jgi:putative methyltransferase (TIGR04325 family)